MTAVQEGRTSGPWVKGALILIPLLLLGLPTMVGYVVVNERAQCSGALMAPQTTAPDTAPLESEQTPLEAPVAPPTTAAKAADSANELAARGTSAPATVSMDYRALLFPTWLLSLAIFGIGAAVSLLGARAPRAIALRVPADAKDREFAKIWASECASVTNQRDTTRAVGVAFACLAALVPGLCANLLLYLLSTCADVPESETIRASLKYAAIGTLAAALTSLCLSFAEFSARLTGRDLNDRAFGSAARSLLLASLCAVVAAILVSNHYLSDNPWVSTPTDMLFVGIIIGVVGDYLFVAAIETVSLIFGHTSGLDEDIQSFIWIDGVDDQEGVRLREIGIRSAQALAFSSPAYIYFRTRYSLERICDWQDQALLYVLFGQPLVKELRLIYSFRGALDLLALIEAELTRGAVDSGLVALAHLQLQLNQPQLTALAVWRRCQTVDIGIKP